jgi:hypothetical protein
MLILILVGCGGSDGGGGEAPGTGSPSSSTRNGTTPAQTDANLNDLMQSAKSMHTLCGDLINNLNAMFSGRISVLASGLVGGEKKPLPTDKATGVSPSQFLTWEQLYGLQNVSDYCTEYNNLKSKGLDGSWVAKHLEIILSTVAFRKEMSFWNTYSSDENRSFFEHSRDEKMKVHTIRNAAGEFPGNQDLFMSNFLRYWNGRVSFVSKIFSMPDLDNLTKEYLLVLFQQSMINSSVPVRRLLTSSFTSAEKAADIKNFAVNATSLFAGYFVSDGSIGTSSTTQDTRSFLFSVYGSYIRKTETERASDKRNPLRLENSLGGMSFSIEKLSLANVANLKRTINILGRIQDYGYKVENSESWFLDNVSNGMTFVNNAERFFSFVDQKRLQDPSFYIPLLSQYPDTHCEENGIKKECASYFEPRLENDILDMYNSDDSSNDFISFFYDHQDEFTLGNERVHPFFITKHLSTNNTWEYTTEVTIYDGSKDDVTLVMYESFDENSLKAVMGAGLPGMPSWED